MSSFFSSSGESYLQCLKKTLHKNHVFVFRTEITCAVRDAHSKDHHTGFNKKNSEMSSFFHLWRVLSAMFFQNIAQKQCFCFPAGNEAVRDAHSKDHRKGFNKKLNVLILEICC